MFVGMFLGLVNFGLCGVFWLGVCLVCKVIDVGFVGMVFGDE